MSTGTGARTRAITLLTDFGAGSPYPGAMKGVILGLVPGVPVVDLTHEIQPQNVQEGAFVLWSVARDFPEGTVHCAVVDPGVGTERRGLILVAGGQFFVGPDNGLLDPAACALGEPRAYAITGKRYLRERVSYTFHGRDVFAPVAAHLAADVPPEEIGKPVDSWVKLEVDFQGGRWDGREGSFVGQVVYIDRFGNAVTNIPAEPFLQRVSFEQAVTLAIGERKHERAVKLRQSYGYAAPGEVCLVLGSHDLVEISVREGSAREALGLQLSDLVRLKP